MTWVLLIISILFEVCGTLSLRASNGLRRKRWLISVVACYGLAFTFFGIALANGIPVAIAYALWTAIGVALIALLGRALWQEPLTRRMALGFALIIVGVGLVEVGALV